jgi:hypothetical protein
MAALLKLIPDTQVKAIRELGLSGSQVEAIESGNARRLLPRLAVGQG